MKYYVFYQNNSGGGFDIYEADGIGEYVIIEAENERNAIDTALDIGIYFHGVEDEIDCECCGDRWGSPEEFNNLEEAEKECKTYFGNPSYVHFIDGTIKKVGTEPKKDLKS